MNRLEPNPIPTALPTAHLEVAWRLEGLGIRAWYHGDALLGRLLPSDPDANASDQVASGVVRVEPSRALLCEATAQDLLAALPQAVVTSEGRRRMSLGTSAGPIDLLPLEGRAIDDVLRRFGLSVLAIAWNPIGEVFCDPTDALDLLSRGKLDVTQTASAGALDRNNSDAGETNAFALAPRRYWIAARLLSEYDLDGTPSLLRAARDALPECRTRIPEGAPARRELERVLSSQNPSKGLAFLHSSGICEALFPGMHAAGAAIVGALDPNPGLRWAAWLAGTPIQSALRRLRMPMRRAREIERLLRHHPIDRKTAPQTAGDAGIRRIHQRLHAVDIEGLLRWRELEIDGLTPTQETRADRAHLDEIRNQLSQLATYQSQADLIRGLAIDGTAVMEILGRGPGRHIGQALAHLAEVVTTNPAANSPEKLEAEVRNWSSQHPE